MFEWKCETSDSIDVTWLSLDRTSATDHPRTPPDDAVAKQLKEAGVDVQTIDEAQLQWAWSCAVLGRNKSAS